MAHPLLYPSEKGRLDFYFSSRLSFCSYTGSHKLSYFDAIALGSWRSELADFRKLLYICGIITFFVSKY